ncbi:MAG TPA: hypothetical protein VFJ57_04310 [Solirubrobacterales bacterium]|nr:hypothetical protein [Solirubrobacterales bacterium]
MLALLSIGLGTALAEGEEEGGGGPTDPVIVPETEAPPVNNPTTTPSEPSTPVTSSPTPAPESAPASSGGTHTSSPSTGSRGSSGGSNGTPTQTNSGVANSGGSDRGGSGGSSGGGGSTTSAPTGSSSPTPSATTADRSTHGVESTAGAGAPRGPHAAGGDKKSASEAGADPGEAGLGDGVSVAKPKHHSDGVADFVPLPGKSKTLYFLLVLVILAIASFLVWTQFRGPRASRRRKAHIDHRVASAARLTPTERVRARQWGTQQGRRARTARRKAA